MGWGKFRRPSIRSIDEVIDKNTGQLPIQDVVRIVSETTYDYNGVAAMTQ
jgi:hypothetical protein